MKHLQMDNEDIYETVVNKKFDPQTGNVHLLEPEYIEVLLYGGVPV